MRSADYCFQCFSFDPLDFLNPTLAQQFSTDPAGVSSIILSAQLLQSSLAAEIERLKQATTITVAPSVTSSWLTSVVLHRESLDYRLWGPYAPIVTNFAQFAYDSCLFIECAEQFYSKEDAFFSASPSGLFVYTADPPCCGGCTITGQRVEISYWPTPAPTPPVTELVGTNGFT